MTRCGRAAFWAAAMFAAGAFGAAEARAQGIDEFGVYGASHAEPAESSQDMALELRFGRYRPNVDSEFDGATPYASTFGDGLRFQAGIEVDWQALRIPKLGTLGPGVGIAYTRSGADARLSDTGEPSAQRTTLWIIPAYVAAVLRADVFAREVYVPLVPYAKLGLGLAVWSSGDGTGVATDDEGTSGRGISYGGQFALGLMLLLDALNPEDAKALDLSVGVNNSYLFAEWFVSDLSGFGAGDVMQVGTNTWVLGLAFEF